MRAFVTVPVASLAASSSCVGMTASSSSCVNSGTVTSFCLASDSGASICISQANSESTCLTPISLADASCLTPQEVLSECFASITPQTSCIQPVSASSICQVPSNPSSVCIVPDFGGTSCLFPRDSNWISWQALQDPDWLVIRPIYTSAVGAELRSRVGITLKTLKSPTSPVYTFPNTEDLAGGNPIAVRGLNVSGTVLSFATLVGTTLLPLNTNIEALYPNLINAYQTDSNTGPSEKTLISLKRLRALGFDLVDLRFGMFYINSNFDISEVGLELALYTGGVPTVISLGGSLTDWTFPGSTLLLQEVIYTRSVLPVLSEATMDTMLSFSLNLRQRFLNFFPQP